MELEKTLLDLKKKVEHAKAEQARAEGALEEAWKRVQADFGVSSLEEIEHLLDETDAEIAKLESELQQEASELKKAHGL